MAAATPPPNLLIVMADQLASRFLPCYGHPVVRAPALEALAAEGVVFDAAYCNTPLCAPSRAAFMSGRLASRTGAYDNAAEFRSDIPSFAHHLRLAGYRTILSGKMHFCGPDQLHGFEERLTTDIYPADFAWTPDWRRPDHRPDWYHTMRSVAQAGPCIRTNQIDYDEEVVFAATRRLYELARLPRAAPFCMVVSMTHPHDPFAIPDPYWSLYRDEQIDMPGPAVAPADCDPHSRRLRHACAIDAQPVSDAQIRAARRAYYGAISFVDAQVGRLRDTLRQCGFARDTVVLFLADHGEMLGERGLWYKMSFFEGSARVPLIVHAPSRFAPRRVAQPVSLIDVLPTLLDLAEPGAAALLPTPVDGSSLLPWLDGDTGHSEVFGEYLAEGAIAPIVMVRRERYKFIHCPADPDQLFDLAADPGERTNLAEAAAHASLVAQFRAEVAARWDLPHLHADVLDSQARRRLIDAALRVGRPHPWDHQPFEDASQRFVRNTVPLDDLEAMARFPRVAPGGP